MIKKISSGESLFLQGLTIITLLGELDYANFLESDYFSKMEYKDEEYKLLIEKTGIGNTALFQMMLYTLLVLPKELGVYEDTKFLDNINKKIDNLVQKTETFTTYKKDFKNKDYDMDYLRHIRNAVSHGRCEYSNYNDKKYFVVFKDQNPNDEKQKCQIKIETDKINEIILMLRNRLVEYLKGKHDLKELARNLKI